MEMRRCCLGWVAGLFWRIIGGTVVILTTYVIYYVKVKHVCIQICYFCGCVRENIR